MVRERGPLLTNKTTEWISTGHRILVTGGTGLVGSRIVEAASGKDGVFSVSRGQTSYAFKNRTPEIVNFDLFTSGGEIEKLLKEKAPTLVIHCAAKADVDACQKDQKDAWEQNVIVTRDIASACQKLGIPMGFCSTDYVFPREGGSFSESDARWPIWGKDGTLNFYSWTKIKAEEQVEAILGRDRLYFIFRITYPYDPTYIKKPGTPVRAFWNLANGEAWTRIEDMAVTPTPVSWIAFTLAHMIRQKVWEKENPVYHIAGPGTITGGELVDICINELAARGICVDRKKIKSTTTGEYFKGKAPRPTGDRVTTEKIKEMGIKIPSLREEIKNFPLPKDLAGSSL